MTKQGDLPFDFTDGSCNTFQTFKPWDHIEHIYLCFGSGNLIIDNNEVPMEFGCYYTDGGNLNRHNSYNAEWESVKSEYSHRNTLGLGNFQGHPFVTGCDRGPDCFTKTEIIVVDIGGMVEQLGGNYVIEWNADMPEYPFASDSRSVDLFLPM